MKQLQKYLPFSIPGLIAVVLYSVLFVSPSGAETEKDSETPVSTSLSIPLH